MKPMIFLKEETMFKRIKGFIRMKLEQRELRSRMSEKTYRQLMLIQDDLMKLRDRLSEESMKELEKNGAFYTTFERYSWDVYYIWSYLDDIMHAPKRP
jgi:hypothetical protein